MTYSEAKAIRDQLEAIATRHSDKLNRYPRGPMGLTPDHIKASDQWRADYRAYHVAAARFREYNRRFAKAYKAEIRAERDARRAALMPLTA